MNMNSNNLFGVIPLQNNGFISDNEKTSKKANIYYGNGTLKKTIRKERKIINTNKYNKYGFEMILKNNDSNNEIFDCACCGGGGCGYCS